MNQNNLPGLLIIDDDKDFREGITLFLETKYYNILDVEAFSEGVSALGQLREVRFSRKKHVIVLLDYLLENSPKTGKQVFDEIVSKYPQFTVIVFTGKDPVHAQEKLGQGAYATMHKPLDNNELCSIIDGIIAYDAVFNKVAVAFENVTKAKATLVFKFHRDKGHFGISGKCSQVKSRQWPNIQIKWTPEFHRHLWDIKRLKLLPWEAYSFRNYNKEDLQIHADYVLRIPIIRMNKLKGFIDCFFDNETQLEETPDMVANIESLKQTAIESIRAAKLNKHHHALNELNQQLTLTPNGGEQFLNTILDQVLRVVSAQSAWIDVLEINNPEKVYLKQSKYSDQGEIKNPVGLERDIAMGDITGQVAIEKKLCYYPDLDDLDELPNTHKTYPNNSNFKAEVAIPLRKGSRIVGVLTVKSVFPDFLSMDDIDFLRSVASITATSIETEKLITGIGELNTQTLMNEEQNTLPKLIVNTVKNLTGTAVNFWKIGDKNGNGTNYMYIIESTDDVPENYRKKRLPNDPDLCFNAQALADKKFLIVNKIQDHPQKHKYWFLEEAKENGWLSFAAVPILGIEQEPIGVISLYSKFTSLFKSDIEVVDTFAQNVSTAYQLQTKSRIMGKLSEATERLTEKSFDSSNFVKDVFDSLERASSADLMVLFFDSLRSKPYISNGTYKKNYEDIRMFDPYISKHNIIFISDINKKEILLPPGKELTPEKQDALKAVMEVFRTSSFNQEHKMVAMAAAVLTPQETKGTVQKQGYIYTFYKEPRYFNHIERRASLIYIGLLTNLLREYLGYHEIKAGKRMMAALYQSGLAIRQGNNAEEVAMKILDSLQKIINYTEEASIQEIPGFDKKRIILAKKGPLKDTDEPRLVRPVSDDQLIQKIYKTGKPIIISDIKNTADPNTRFWEVLPATEKIKSWVGIPLKDGKKVIGLLTLGHRVTNYYRQDIKRKLVLFADQAGMAIIRAKQLEEKSWINLGHMAGSLAHRIGNKGGIIKLDLNDIKEKLGNLSKNNELSKVFKELQEKLESISNNNNYILNLSQELFRPTHASKEEQYPVDLVFLIQSALQNARVPKDITVTDNFNDITHPIWINGNSFFIEMFLEIITNAVQAMQNRPEKVLDIYLNYKKKDHEVNIHFEDTGNGLSDTQKKDIFNLFSSTNTNTGINHGFGLWWINVFLDNIGGKIKVKNRPEKDKKGAIFTITLPTLKNP